MGKGSKLSNTRVPTAMTRTLPRFLVLAAILAGYAFFGWHAFYGARSFAYQEQVQARLAETRQRLAEIRARRQRVERRNALLRSESLDPDMLDEMARRQLGFAGRDEYLSLGRP